MVPFLVLTGVVVGLGIFFFQVTRPLLLPLFLAAVTAMLAHPLQQRMTGWLRGHEYLAAGAVTLLIVVAIVGPLGTVLTLAVRQLAQAVSGMQEFVAQGKLPPAIDPKLNPTLAHAIEWFDQSVPIELEQLKESGLKIAGGAGKILYQRSVDFLGDVAHFFLSLCMYLIAVFFFLVDGPRIVVAWEALTPMDAEHDRIVRLEFTKVCRGVVLATVVAALAQGLLFGLGIALIEPFAQAGLWRWIVLLSILTCVFSMVPLLGAASVWVTTSIVLFLNGHPWAGVLLAVYGGGIISTSDNALKMLVLKDSADLHPLLVLVSVFGGIQLVGILGVFIGPIVGAVLFALMRVLKKELLHFDEAEGADAIDSSES